MQEKKRKLDKIYTCSCGHEYKVKKILVMKMELCKICGSKINQDEVYRLLDEYKMEKRKMKEVNK